ncbi:hypothetical protein [Sphingobacterium paludis]|nr:hypothetical protein [Sphingobacterium paludis]
MRQAKLLAMLCLWLVGSGMLFGQELHSSLQLRNNHLWRGIEVASGLVYTGDIKLAYKNVYGGFWAAGNTSGSYKEFNNFVGYKHKRFAVELWDIYNFSPDATYNNTEFFNYRNNETGRFFDFRTFYTLSETVPLIISWNTVLFGRDRDLQNSKNKFSTFVSGEYPIVKNEQIEVRGRLGYSFALNNGEGEQANFFSRNAGFNEISLMLSRNLKVGDIVLPLGLWGMWNPVDNRAFLQFSVQAYSF